MAISHHNKQVQFNNHENIMENSNVQLVKFLTADFNKKQIKHSETKSNSKIIGERNKKVSYYFVQPSEPTNKKVSRLSEFLMLIVFIQLNIIMKTYSKNGLPFFNSPTSVSSQPAATSLQDSKSTSNLYQSAPDTKKFRETTFFPTTSKNTNREFLRYTVNLNKSEKETFTAQVSPNQNGRIQRKFTIQDSQKKSIDSQESPTVTPKPNSAQKKSERKNTNPQRKQQPAAKQSPLPKFLQKKLATEDTALDSTYKTQRAQTHFTFTSNSIPQKKTFTPKCVSKAIDGHEQSNKIIASYSSTDLLKLNHVNSPTCESLTSRMALKEEQSKGPSIDDFKRVKFLGQGKFGQVHLVFHIKTQTVYAMKQIKKDSIAKNKMEDQLLMQIKMQFFLNHPNILKLYGVFNDEENIYLILEYMEEGTLYSVLKKKKTLKQIDGSHKLRDVLDGMSYLHSMNVAHRDIKPQNIVISHDVCKICDLGWAAVCDDRRKTLCGTIDYASPQLLQGKQYGIAIDLWCLGVLCFELMVGKCPFYHISRKETMRKIINADLSDLGLPATLPAETKDFICKLLLKNPEQRMSAESALQHPLIRRYYDEDLEDIRNIHKRKG